MGSSGDYDHKKPHAVCVPYPAQGHINPMLKLAKILHHRGFHITFVNTEYNHNRLLKSRGAAALDGLPDFRFAAIPDGLPPSEDTDTTQDVRSLCLSTNKNCLAPLRDLLVKLNSSGGDSSVPPVTCVVGDASMVFAVDAAEEFGLTSVVFCTMSACGFMGYAHYAQLVERGLIPLKDESYLTNGYLDTVIDWIPGMKNIRLKDLPSFIQTTDSDDPIVKLAIHQVNTIARASVIVFNTYDALEHDLLEALLPIFPRTLTMGPLHLFLNQIPQNNLKSSSIGSNLWKEEPECLQWLNSKEPNSVVYVNFGSITIITPKQLTEFAWGLANSKHAFLWVIRPDLVKGDVAILPPEFVEETKERGMLPGWCPQDEVINHPAIGGFLTHNGWNSTLESVSAGVPMLCWPFFAEQQTNCWFSCNVLGVGMEIDNNVKREEVEKQVRELMEGEKGSKMREMALGCKKMAEEAIGPNGSSYLNLDKLVNQILLSSKP